MDSLNFLGPLLFIAGVAVVLLVAVAIVQDLKQDRKYGYRQAFNTIIALVMLVMAVGSIESLLVTAGKELLPQAKKYQQRFDGPPAFYLMGDVNNPKAAPVSATGYTCTDKCEFTAADKESFTNWKQGYLSWRDSNNVSLQTRRNVAGALSLLIVSLPLFWLFFRAMNRGAKEEYAINPKPSPLRSVYFYGVSFAGLVVAVVGGAFLLNTVFNKWLNVTSDASIVTPAQVFASDTVAVDGVINCAAKCEFSTADVQLAKDWKADWQAYRDKQSQPVGSTQNDLANTIPLILVGLPIFWYHFARIRKETSDVTHHQPTT